MKNENNKNDIKEAISSGNLMLAQKVSYNELIKRNREWVDLRLKDDPEYFKNLAKGQSPEVLWIGA